MSTSSQYLLSDKNVCTKMRYSHIVSDLLLASYDGSIYQDKLSLIDGSVDFINILDSNGITIEEKLKSLYSKYNITMDPNIFQSDLSEYVRLKYLFSLLLYGNLDLKYLTQEFNEKFFMDMVLSKYRNFLPLFSQFEGFNKYFIYTVK